MTAARGQLRIPVYLTPEHSCPYLPGQTAVTGFVGTDTPMDKDLFSALLRSGYRRSGRHVYRPRCPHCAACVAVRIPVQEFDANRSQRRCLKRNDDLTLAWAPPELSEEHYALYERYINTRHVDGDMYPAQREQFFEFLLADWCETRLLEIRWREKLIAVAVVDIVNDGFSAVYSFFSPELAGRGLGVYVILCLVAMARLEGLPHVYLGYFIGNCRKMNYKAQYRPLHAYIEDQWQRLPDFAG